MKALARSASYIDEYYEDQFGVLADFFAANYLKEAMEENARFNTSFINVIKGIKHDASNSSTKL